MVLWPLRRILGVTELLVYEFTIYIVSDTDELLVVVRASQEQNCYADKVLRRDLARIWRVGLSD
jgi:hypothetical protein